MKHGSNAAVVRVKIVRRAALLVCLVLWLSPSAARAQADAGPKRVLVLYWYNKDYPWNVNFDRSIQAALQTAPAGPFEYYPEYLETDRFPGEHQSRLLHDHLRRKYADRQIDLLVATSDASLNFLLEYRADLFPQAPIVFNATRHPTAEQLAAGPGMTGLNILTDHRQTVDLALRFHPDTKQIFIVSGTLEHDKRLETLAREQLQGYESRVEVEYLTDLRPEELAARTKALPERSLVLYVWQQSRSEQGRVLETREVLAAFAPSARVPIYGMTNVYVGSGAVGGYMNLAETAGAKTGEIVARIASGVRPHDIPVENAPLVPVFDWRELRRWGIGEDRLPPGSVVRFKELTFWGQYRWQIIGAISLCLFEAFLIFALLAQRARRSRAEQENRKLIHRLGERVKELTALHHTARILQDEGKSIPELLRGVVELLPPAWQYPEVAAARIRFGETEWKTPNFSRTRWSQGAEFHAGGLRGAVEVFYLEERPEEDIGPFQAEEKKLLDSLAEMIQSALNRRVTQDELRASEERFTKAFQASPVPIAILNDRDRTFLEVNESWETVFGYRREETVGRTALELDFFDVEDRDRLRALGERQGFLRDEGVDVRTKQGETRHVTMSAERFMIGRELCNICLFRDITERKQVEEALRKSENLWRTIFDNAAIGIAIVNSEGRLVETNAAFQRIVGYPKEELRHLWFVDFTHPDDTAKEFPLHQEMIDGKRDHYQMEKRYVRKDGQVRWVNLIASVIPAEQPGEAFGVGMVEDITERKHAEEKLKASTAQLRALSESLRRAREEEGIRIARELHDELGAALTSIKWSLLELDKVSPAGGGPGGGAHEKIAEMVGLADSTINTVRRISSELRPGVLNELGLVAAFEWHAQQFEEHTGIVCRFDSLVDDGGLDREQATAVFRIFQEAMTNILRHAGASKVNIIMEDEEGEFVLEIKDNGRGITESESRGSRSLGLLGMRERAHSVGGKIEINGRPGRGTVLILRLPIERAAAG
jgi:PAS domain S-box-containing protein